LLVQVRIPWLGVLITAVDSLLVATTPRELYVKIGLSVFIRWVHIYVPVVYRKQSLSISIKYNNFSDQQNMHYHQVIIIVRLEFLYS
jgi:hypothetical protein